MVKLSAVEGKPYALWRLSTIDRYQKGSLSYKPERKEGVAVQHTHAALRGMGSSKKNIKFTVLI